MYRDIISTSKGRKRDLELEIQEPSDRIVVKQTLIASRSKQTSSTKNKESDNSIFSVIERAKAKSNGTTPQNAIQPSPQADQTPSSKKSPIRNTPLNSLHSSEFTNLSAFLAGAQKTSREFISPTSLDQISPNTIRPLKKKSKSGFSFISNIFGKQYPQSPARMTLAKKFLQEKLGEEKVNMIEKLHENNSGNYLAFVKDVLGPDLRHVLPVVEYIFGKSQTQSLKMSPISASGLTLSTTHEQQDKVDANGLTFGFDALAKK